MKKILFFFLAFPLLAGQYYVVKDMQGNVLWETDSKKDVIQMRNVQIDTLSDTKKIVVLPEGTVSDDLRAIFNKEFGSPIYEEIFYEIEWKTTDSGSVRLIKSEKGPPKLIADYKGRTWIKSNILGILKER
jgi:hypothetical protein